MKCLVVLSFLLTCTEINSLNNCTREGEIRVIGTNTTCSLAGRLELCSELMWRAVCEAMWDRAEAMVVCQQFGFPCQGALACTGSCFGRNDNIEGINNFICSGEEDSLLQCQPQIRNGPCVEHAGIVCSELNGVTTLYQQPINYTTTEETTIHTYHYGSQCECPSTPAEIDSETIHPATSKAGKGSEGHNRITIIGALVGVSTILLLILMGVVMGWVCTCYRSNSCSRRAISNKTIITQCATRANVCYGIVNIKEASCGDNAIANLNIETNVSYNVIVGGTSLPQKQREEEIYQEVEGTI